MYLVFVIKFVHAEIINEQPKILGVSMKSFRILRFHDNSDLCFNLSVFDIWFLVCSPNNPYQWAIWCHFKSNTSACLLTKFFIMKNKISFKMSLSNNHFLISRIPSTNTPSKQTFWSNKGEGGQRQPDNFEGKKAGTLQNVRVTTTYCICYYDHQSCAN